MCRSFEFGEGKGVHEGRKLNREDSWREETEIKHLLYLAFKERFHTNFMCFTLQYALYFSMEGREKWRQRRQEKLLTFEPPVWLEKYQRKLAGIGISTFPVDLCFSLCWMVPIPSPCLVALV